MISGSKNLPRKSACHCLTAAQHHLILYWCHKDEHILPLKHPKCFGGLVGGGGCKYALPGKWADPVKVADELGARGNLRNAVVMTSSSQVRWAGAHVRSIVPERR